MKQISYKTDGTEHIGRGFFWMALSGTVSIANSVVLWIFLARMRPAEELGRFTIVMAVYALFVSVCSLGLMPYFVTEIRRLRDKTNGAGRTVVGFISGAS